MKNKLMGTMVALGAPIITFGGSEAKQEVKSVEKKEESTYRLEDRLINVSDVTVELNTKTRKNLKKSLDKYGVDAKFSLPVKVVSVEYSYRGDVRKRFDSLVYFEPTLAKRVVNDKSVNAVVFVHDQKKHLTKNVFVVKDGKKIVLVYNLEPETKLVDKKPVYVKKEKDKKTTDKKVVKHPRLNKSTTTKNTKPEMERITIINRDGPNIVTYRVKGTHGSTDPDKLITDVDKAVMKVAAKYSK